IQLILMDYEFLISDLNLNKSQKIIGTDKGLAKIGDGIVNIAYSVAKSIFLTKNNPNDNIIRTGKKVGKVILGNALKNARMKSFAKTRANTHDLADTVESIVAYIWLSNKMSIKEIIEFLVDNLSGDLYDRNEEIEKATLAFTNLLNYTKQFLPEI
ncbi:MAG: ribonuclease III family protein, partial [Promethearchaeota archaeon]